MTSAKLAIKALLDNSTNGVKVYDDTTPTPVQLTGKSQETRPDDNDFATNVYVISIGPVYGSDSRFSAMGAAKKWIKEFIQVDIWVMERRSQTWAAEKTRSDLVQEVDRCLLHYASTPGTGFRVVNATSWRELDESGMKHSSVDVVMEYEKARA